MSGHTHGPWKVIERKLPFSLNDGRSGEHVERWVYTAWRHPQSKGFYPVVTLSTGLGPQGEPPVRMVHISEADARLIATAPELLEALKETRKVLSFDDGPFSDNGVLSHVNAIIAKAEGES